MDPEVVAVPLFMSVCVIALFYIKFYFFYHKFSSNGIRDTQQRSYRVLAGYETLHISPDNCGKNLWYPQTLLSLSNFEGNIIAGLRKLGERRWRISLDVCLKTNIMKE